MIVNIISRYEALVAFIVTALWLLLIASLHFIKSELKPSTSLVSEYAIKPKGWIMQVAFFCMGVGCFAFVLAAWPYINKVGLILLAIVSLSFTGAGIFVTDPVFIGEGGQTRNGKLHVLFAFIVIFLFPIMSTVIDITLGKSTIWSSIHDWLPALSLLVWSGFIVFIAVSGYKVSDAQSPVGYAERFLVIVFSTWLLAVSLPIFYQ